MGGWNAAKRGLIRGMRRAAKQVAGAALDWSGARKQIANWDRQRAGGLRVQIFAWHRVVPDFDRMVRRVIPGLLTSTETFDRQLAWLRQNYRIGDLDQALEILSGRAQSDRDFCVLTFDDGYRDFAEHALPILRRHGLPAVVYVTTGIPESGLPLLHDRLFHLLRMARRRGIDGREAVDEERVVSALQSALRSSDPIVALEWLLETQPRKICLRVAEWLEERMGEGPDAALADSELLRWEDLRGIEGPIEVGAHTVDHACLPNEAPAEIERQLVGSKADLEERLGRNVSHFAYPNGWYAPSVIRAVEKAGFRSAVTTEDRANHLGVSPYCLKRRSVWEYTSRGLIGFSKAVNACNFDGTLRALGIAPWVPGERPDGLGAGLSAEGRPSDPSESLLSGA